MTQIQGTVEREPPIYWGERGTGLLKLVEHEKLIRIKELQKYSLPKGLKKGDKFTAEVEEDGRYYSLKTVLGEADSGDSSGSQTRQMTPQQPEQPPMIVEGPEWYRQLVSDCREIVASGRCEFVAKAQRQLLETYHRLGTQIRDSVLGRGRPRTETEGKTLDDLAADVNVGKATLKKALLFARRFPTIETYFEALPSLRAQKNGECITHFSPLEPLPTWYETVQLLSVGQQEAQAEHREMPDRLEIQGDSDREPLSTDLFWRTVWRLNDRRPKGYGSEQFRGNTPPELLAQCLTRYTNPGDLVLDPMAGSGTTIDVCKAMGRRVIASDIKAWREDIPAVDAEELAVNEPVDFAFMHIPYLDMYEYTDDPNDLSKMKQAAFEEKMERIIAHVTGCLKSDRFLAILVGDIRKSGLIDLTARVSVIGQRHLRLWDKAIIETTNIGAHSSAAHGNIGLVMNRAKRLNFLVPTHDALLIFRKPSK